MATIDQLFKQMIELKGSDLHLKQGQRPKVRVNGHIKDLVEHISLDAGALGKLMQEITDPPDWQSFEVRGDLDFAYALGETARFRANYFRHCHGLGAIFRLIPSKILTIEELGMPDILKTLGDFNSGLVLVTGPTGSGKSTTLAAIIDHINSNKSKKIVTIEEPVEFIHKNKKSLITHREVGLDTASFTSGLKGAFKSDANVILVGEMRDKETIELALTAAQMGILVFGTLHTNSAAKTIDRIVDVFPANKKNQIRSVLANSLRAIVAQQLLRSVDGDRRYAANEILLRSPGLGAIIRSGESIKLVSEIQMGRQAGMILMDDCLQKLIMDGKITKTEAYLKAIDKSKFQ
ncbi:MAG: PilT/PilU family type 4a pilus ATPase [Candidatus Omnitrophica bacterium]|nr:PilT/PilU family type 4a pilus ATPase [Candidatus Omnitrophota bacterium]